MVIAFLLTIYILYERQKGEGANTMVITEQWWILSKTAFMDM